MDAARKAAGASFSGDEVCAESLDVRCSRFCFFYRDNPTNPLIACEWCEAFPGGLDFWRRGESVLHVFWGSMNWWFWHSLFHLSSIAKILTYGEDFCCIFIFLVFLHEKTDPG